MLYLSLLGGASLDGAGRRVAGPAAQKRRLALLARLALANGRGVTRDKLIGYLWPENQEEKGRHLLSDSIYRINQAAGGEAIVTSGDALRLDSSCLPCDVVQFEAAVERGDQLSAVRLYQGAFLDGFFLDGAHEFDRWVETERERLAYLFATALEGLAEAAGLRGNQREVVTWWRRLAAHDPFSSRVALRLVQTLAATGDRASALNHARTHESLLRTEWGVEPAAEFAASAAAALESATAVAAAPAAVAVLPFVDLRPGNHQAHFVDGMTEEVILSLSRVEPLRVSSRTSVFSLRDQALDVREVGRRLGVTHVIEGSVRQAGQKLRITAQLVDARNGYQLWSEQLDREMDDVFTVQEEVAGWVTGAFRVRLASGLADQPS